MTLVVAKPPPNPTLDRIRALLPQAHVHVPKQHVVSQVILRRFAASLSTAHAGKIARLNLAQPHASVKHSGSGGCGYVMDFVRFASQSLELLWKETEDRLPEAIDACLNQNVFARPDLIQVLKNAIVMHHVRSVHMRKFLDAIWDVRIAEMRWSFLTTHRAMTEREFVRRYHGLIPAGDAGLAAVVDDALAQWVKLKQDDGFFRESLERLYRLGVANLANRSLEVATPASGNEFLIGDAPALAIAEDGRIGVRDGVGLDEAVTIALPLTPQCTVSFGDTNAPDAYITLTGEQTDVLNLRQVNHAAQYICFRPDSGLETLVRAAAVTQRKQQPGHKGR